MARPTVGPKFGLTVNAWVSSGGKEAPFGAEDMKGRTWFPVFPFYKQGLVCRRCGRVVRFGWSRGLHGRTAYCRTCVSLTDSHQKKGGDQ